MKANAFACLMYHFIRDDGGRYSVSARQFDGHLAYLQDRGFVVEGFEQLERRIANGEPFPERYALMTIDDGELSCIRFADALSRHGFKGTFFVVRDYARQSSDHLDEEQIMELRRGGFSIGTHGASHLGLARMPLDAARKELRESRDWLEQLLGEPVRYMSAPHGYVNSQVMKAVFQTGYTLAGTSTEAVNFVDRLRLPAQIARVAVRRGFTLHTLDKIISGYRPFYAYRQLRSAVMALPKRIFA